MLFEIACFIEEFLWIGFAFPLILALGLFLSYKSKFVQIRRFPKVLQTFAQFLRVRELEKGAVHPLKAFFAAVGGSLGIGNVVAVCTAIQIGGPGALFWLWITAIVSVMVKYSEVYLGIKFRVPNASGSYDGGPMYFLRKAFAGTWAPKFVAFFLCLYGVEIYQFNVIADSISTNFNISEYIVVALLLLIVLFAGSGGVRRVGNIASGVIPLFVILYAGMGLWVLANHFMDIPSVLVNVLANAFTGHAAVGGFLGSTFLMAISQGVRTGVYTGDLGIGYASVIYSESSEQNFEKQASLVFFSIFIDTFIICTTSILLILATGVWSQPISASMMVQTSLSQYFPYMNYFMPFFLFLLGYTTINAYFVVGLKCADYLSPKRGKLIYYIYAIIILVLFSFVEQNEARSVMNIVAALLVLVNGIGIWKLRNEISYRI